MSSRSGKIWNVGLGVFLLILLLFMTLVGESETQTSDSPSTRNFDPEGRRAAFQLLEHFSAQPVSWALPPASLPTQGGTLFLPRPPVSVFDREDGDLIPQSPLSEETGDSSLNIHLPVHYRRFLDRGGVLITSAEEEMITFLDEQLEIEEVRDLETSWVGEDSERKTILSDGEELLVDWGRQFEKYGLDEFYVWAHTDDSEPTAVSLQLGNGELILLADGEVLSNEALRDGDEGTFLLRMLEEFDRTGAVLFDEYSLGYWRPESAGTFALTGDFRQTSLQFLFLVLLFAWRLAWVGRFPRDPEPFELLSPMMRVTSQAQLIERAGRYDLLALWLKRGFVDRVQKFWRMRPSRATEGTEAEALESSMANLAARAGVDPAKWKQPLETDWITSERALRELQDSLEEYERELTCTD